MDKLAKFLGYCVIGVLIALTLVILGHAIFLTPWGLIVGAVCTILWLVHGHKR